MKTDIRVKAEGMRLIIDNLGYVDAERFMMLMYKEFIKQITEQSKNLDRDIEYPSLKEKLEEYEKQLEN